MLTTLIFIILATIYAIIDFFLLQGLSHLEHNSPSSPQGNDSDNSSEIPPLTPLISQESSYPMVNILLCARNEQKKIAQTIESILLQDYPSNRWKLLIADDRSEDQTPEIIDDYKKKYPKSIEVVRIDTVPPQHSPKKNALTQLHKIVDADIILTTDADCRVPSQWIRSMVSHIEQDFDMVIGHAYYKEDMSIASNLWGLQALDFFSHGVVAAGSVGMGTPINSNANNLCYKKKCFDEVKGYENLEQIVSGDDDLLLHKFIRRNFNICYNVDARSFVNTDAQRSYRGVWEQRKRWASKTIYYTRPVVFMLSTIFLFYLCICYFFISGIFSSGNFWIGIALLIWKSFFDYLVMERGAKIFHKKALLKWYIPLSIIHPFLIVGAVLKGYISGFQWKDNKTKGST